MHLPRPHAPNQTQVLRTDGIADPLLDCVTVVGILKQMAVLREMSPELHERTRPLNVHLLACYKVNDSEYRAVLEITAPAAPQLAAPGSLIGMV